MAPPSKDHSWRPIFKKFRSRCVYCGKSLIKDVGVFEDSNIDHAFPISKGGAYAKANQSPCCGTCNRLKGDYVPTHVLRKGDVRETPGGRKFFNPESWPRIRQAIKDYIKRELKKWQDELGDYNSPNPSDDD